MNLENKVCKSALELIGHTPMVELARITKGLKGRILAKIEYFNPGFSKKDRIALQTLEEAENIGVLKTGQTVIELTSGNTGTGYAIACSLKGYPYIAVMSKGNTVERARMMIAFGAEVHLVDQVPDAPKGQVSGESLELVEKETQKLTKERNAFRADQFQLDGNWHSHYYHTAEEILNQVKEPIGGFCDFVGTGGSYVGISKKLREKYPKIKCYIVEPASCAVLAGRAISNPNHKIQGGGYSMTDIPFLKHTKIDGYIQIDDNEAIKIARRLASEEGLFAGFSSGANVAAALELLKGELKGETIVVLLNDSGLKYLSTDLFAAFP
ncbi:MAG TPA: cysteine synthase family protein [Candidatus Bathyarchaeia archaeon]|nr:cysteine synthase family protein [Candidatus Bathyarchaeia archaeon]